MTGLDVLGAVSPEVSPADLAKLDRRLTPAEQKRVDDFQAAEASTMQAKEEATARVDPKTGERTVAKVSYREDFPAGWIDPFAKTPAAKPASVSGVSLLSVGLAGLGLVAVLGGVYAFATGGRS